VLTKEVLVLNLKYYIPALAWSILIFILSTGNVAINAPIQWISIDKVGHFTFYAIEVLVLIWAIARHQKWQQSNLIAIFCCAAIAAGYGTSLEFVQASLPHRSFDYADMVANFVGVLVGLMVYYKSATRFFLNK
jgi:VanZ family protein